MKNISRICVIGILKIRRILDEHLSRNEHEVYFSVYGINGDWLEWHLLICSAPRQVFFFFWGGGCLGRRNSYFRLYFSVRLRTIIISFNCTKKKKTLDYKILIRFLNNILSNDVQYFFFFFFTVLSLFIIPIKKKKRF